MPAAAAQPADADAAAAHGLGGAVQIPLSCAANTVPHFRLQKQADFGTGDETALVITMLTSDIKYLEYRFVLGEESPLLIVGPIGPGAAERTDAYRGPAISWEAIAVRDIAGRDAYSLTLERTGSLQRLALLRLPAGDVVLAIANRFTGISGSPSQVDVSVYRLNIEPIPDGEHVYFAPSSSWRTTDSYSTATDALNKTFGISMLPDGRQLCAANAAQQR